MGAGGAVLGGVLSHNRIPGSDEDLWIVSTPERTADWQLRSTLLQEFVRQVRDRGGRVRAVATLESCCMTRQVARGWMEVCCIAIAELGTASVQ